MCIRARFTLIIGTVGIAAATLLGCRTSTSTAELAITGLVWTSENIATDFWPSVSATQTAFYDF